MPYVITKTYGETHIRRVAEASETKCVSFAIYTYFASGEWRGELPSGRAV